MATAVIAVATAEVLTSNPSFDPFDKLRVRTIGLLSIPLNGAMSFRDLVLKYKKRLCSNAQALFLLYVVIFEKQSTFIPYVPRYALTS
jgi:hypothetical protein